MERKGIRSCEPRSKKMKPDPTKDEVQAAADAKGESLNAYIVEAIRQRLESDMPTEDTAGKETA